MPTTDFRLDRLSLRNFRCFSECTLDLHPHLTVLVAENGSGKSAILNAIGIAFGLFVDTVTDTRKNADFDSVDVRLVQEEFFGKMTPSLPTEFLANGFIEGKEICWSRSLKGISSSNRPTISEAEELRQVAQHIREGVDDYIAEKKGEPPLLPLVAYYGTDRHWIKLTRSDVKKVLEERRIGRMAGYSGCLSASSSVTNVVSWFGNTVKETGDPRFATDLYKNLKQLTAVIEATRVVLEPTGWCRLDWDKGQDILFVEHQDNRRLPLSFLSDGIRNMVALVADIARRCATLNPHLGEDAARQTPGVLLIDEIDMHLHPMWQQLVLPALREAFQSIQIVVTTHSPQVLTTVPTECIRILEDGQVHAAPPGTEGAEASRILKRVLGVDVRPPEIDATKELKEYLGLVDTDQWQSPRALELRIKLDARYQGEEPALLEADLRIENRKWELGQ